MLFNSYPFIFVFLPVALAGYFAANRLGATAPVIWLALASVVFYSFSNWPFVALLLSSIAFNYCIGWLLISRNLRERPRFAVLTIGVAGDLLALGVFKYAGFVVANVNAVFGASIVVNIVLPVGISFYTFTQIAFLVDAYRGKVARYGLPHYALFVTYFPHLIAGPILHHGDMIPQFESADSKRPNPRLILYGLIIFAIGLCKKTVLADGIQPLVALAFHQASPSFDQAWIGALAYTFQLYFDFSGYSDMAIGISLMFGIFLPLNFNSPYKATNIIEFWRRWHMTLSQFLRDYLYISLGGNRHGSVLRYLNLMVTMLLGGLWHGAAWTFVVWGALHGLYLCLNHAWINYGPPIPEPLKRPAGIAAFILTFLAVVVAWVFFRADSLASALSVLSRMADPSQIVFGRTEMIQSLMVAIYAALAWFAPNTQAIVGYDHKNRSVGESLAFNIRPLLLYGGAAAFAFGVLGIQQHSEFIYFRF
ncbi:MAG TPA: MBOAT family protein [Bradyrhizobium sp.]|uniref:MBOAT family O-acyltransferase n=1 Tax=Bradyrhizobium sp. TaxID=376 RepID=UPI002D7F4D49|nr:MBOAT family protein [Bradyrhizobium sp.]HET7886832.1 MBOAT family protein [Bradyrhizobium sp.]